jgi:oligoendopeptidase F
MSRKSTIPRWDLSDLLDKSNPNAASEALDSMEKIVKQIESWKKRLRQNMSAKNFIELFKLINRFKTERKRIKTYSELKLYENMSNLESVEFNNRVEEMLTDFDNRLLFFRLWWKDVDSKNAQRLMSSMGKDFHHELRCMHNDDLLSGPEEKTIAVKDLAGFYALPQIYDSLTTNMTFRLKVGGKIKYLTTEEIEEYRYSSNPALRKAAYTEYFGGFKRSFIQSVAYIYQVIMRDLIAEETKLRNHKKPRLYLDNVDNVPDELVEKMLSVIRKNASVFQRYFTLKAKALKLKKLRRYDIYAPFPKPASMRKFSFEEAKELVLGAFYSFSPAFGDAAKKIFDSKHVDAQSRIGKALGAFCSSAGPEIPSYISLHFQGSLDGVIPSLAHELGHGVHAGLAGSHSIGTYEPLLFLTEISSTFAEMIVIDKLLLEAKDSVAKLYILGFALDNIYKSLLRQGYFAVWEHEAAKLVQKEGMTADIMADKYLKICREQFGDSVSVPNEFKWEWVTIPHFYQSPFYVYSYVANQEIALFLFDKYKKKGASFVPKIIRIISAGGSAYPVQILSRAGINVKSERFWQKGFNIVSKMIDEFESLLKEQ